MRSMWVPGPVQNGSDHNSGVAHHLVCRYVQDVQTSPPKGGIALLLPARTIGCRVRPAVDFDDESSLAAEEIDHIRFQRMLAAELETVWALPQELPQQSLRRRHLFAQPPRPIG